MQEFCRRVHHLRLQRTAPEWMRTCGGETTAWRDASEANAFAANSMLTHAWRRCVEGDFILEGPSGILTELGFGPFSDAEQTAQKSSAMLELYEACRAAGPGAKHPASDRTFRTNWINLDSPTLTDLVLACVALDDPSQLRDSRSHVRRELEAQDWNAIVGFDNPIIACNVRVHGSKWGIRFRTTGVIKGRERRNEELPPASPLRESPPAANTSAPASAVEQGADSPSPEDRH